MYELIYNYINGTLFGYESPAFDIYIDFFEAISHIVTTLTIVVFLGFLLMIIRNIIASAWRW